MGAAIRLEAVVARAACADESDRDPGTADPVARDSVAGEREAGMPAERAPDRDGFVASRDNRMTEAGRSCLSRWAPAPLF